MVGLSVGKWPPRKPSVKSRSQHENASAARTILPQKILLTRLGNITYSGRMSVHSQGCQKSRVGGKARLSRHPSDMFLPPQRKVGKVQAAQRTPWDSIRG